MTADLSPTERDQLAELERRARRGLAEMRAALVEAYDRRDWVTLGYPSWHAYLKAEYGSYAGMAAEIVAVVRP